MQNSAINTLKEPGYRTRRRRIVAAAAAVWPEVPLQVSHRSVVRVEGGRGEGGRGVAARLLLVPATKFFSLTFFFLFDQQFSQAQLGST